MESLSALFLTYLYMFGRPAIMVVNLILGIVIICTKEKITKLFGAVITIGSIGGILDVLYQFGLMSFGSAGTVVAFADVHSCLSIALGIASGVFLYLYVKNRYGTKLITGIILLVGGKTMSTVIAFIVGRFITPDSFDNPSQFSYFLFSITTISVLAFPIAWLIIFLKNRHKENELKSLWIVEAIGVADTLFNLSLNLYMFFALSGVSGIDSYSVEVNIEKYQIIGVLVFAVLNLLMSIYVVAKGRKAPKDLEPEVA